MTVTAETAGVAETQAWAANLPAAFTKAAADAVLEESTTTAVEVEYSMPVLTGWAMGRWGNPAVPGGVWEVSEDGLSIEQGSDLEGLLNMFEYIVRLNEGSSSQAPAGFIDMAAERGGDRLENKLDQIPDAVE